MTRTAIQTDQAPSSPSYSQAVAAENLVFVSVRSFPIPEALISIEAIAVRET